jgi:hypothetical protein
MGGNGTYGSSTSTGVGGVGISTLNSVSLNSFGSVTGTGVLSGGNYFYAAGGNASSTTTAHNPSGGGVTNTGGGGSYASNATSSRGGSGLVIIRYLK